MRRGNFPAAHFGDTACQKGLNRCTVQSELGWKGIMVTLCVMFGISGSALIAQIILSTEHTI